MKKLFLKLFAPNKKKDEETNVRKNFQLVLFGTASSGKSTFLKQLKRKNAIIQNFYKDENSIFSPEEVQIFVTSIFYNILYYTKVAAKSLMAEGYSFMLDVDQATFSNYTSNISSLLEKDSSLILSARSYYTVELHKQIEFLWSSIVFQNFVSDRQYIFHMDDGVMYFFQHLYMFRDPAHFCPTFYDFLMCRKRTLGIVQETCEYKNCNFKVYDVGGARSEQRKWYLCFENLTTILYFVNLTDYVRNMYEDDITNKLLFSIELFGEVMANQLSSDKQLFLVLGNYYNFEKLLKMKPLRQVFPDYNGMTVSDAVKYVREQFVNVEAAKNRLITTIVVDLVDCNKCEELITDIYNHHISQDVFKVSKNHIYEYIKMVPQIYEFRQQSAKLVDIVIQTSSN